MPNNLKEWRFLIVDDHSLVRRIIRSTLQELGAADIDEAVDGYAALEKIRKADEENKPYQIVLLDWSMPGMDGYGVLTACRADRRFDMMAIVMLTAESEDANIFKAMSAGATAYMPKPFKTDAFSKKLEDVFAWRAKKMAAAS